MAPEPVIEVNGLTKQFGRGKVLAVDDFSFTVERGQIVGLLGQNGAGKTTTLRALLGLVRPTKGELRIFGTTVRPGIAELSRVGALVEGPGFVPHLSGRRNLEIFWRAGGRPVPEAHLEAALEISGLGTAVDRAVKGYSHGMKQRLGFSQALLGSPELLVLDEPVNGLDPQQIVEVRDALLRLAADGVTILLSSHLLSEVEHTCSHVVVMHQGRLIQSGSVEAVTASVASAYLEVDDPEAALRLLGSLRGVTAATTSPPGIVVALSGASRSDLVAALVAGGIAVDTVVARQSLEDAFLQLLEAEKS